MCQYDVQVSVGGVPCSSQYSYISFAYCALPSFAYDPSVAYDVIVRNDAGSVTLSGLVQYTSAPTLISIDPCIDRGDSATTQIIFGVQCPASTTITLRGSRFPAADSVTVQFTAEGWTPVTVELLTATQLNSTAITATLPALDNITAAAVYGQYGNVQAVFTSADGNTTSNALFNILYLPPNAPSVTSVSSSSCDSVSPLQLTNCRALAVITVVGSNLAVSGSVWLNVYLASAWQGYNYLLPQAGRSNASWYDSLSNTSLVFTMAYFDADTNVQLQPDVVYTLLIESYSSNFYQVSNAFRLSLTYDSATSSTSASSSLSSGAIAGIVIAAVVAAVVLLMVVVWLLRCGKSSMRSRESAGGCWGRLTQRAADSGSDEYRDVEP